MTCARAELIVEATELFTGNDACDEFFQENDVGVPYAYLVVGGDGGGRDLDRHPGSGAELSTVLARVRCLSSTSQGHREGPGRGRPGTHR